jgi:hypothetical protein
MDFLAQKASAWNKVGLLLMAVIGGLLVHKLGPKMSLSLIILPATAVFVTIAFSKIEWFLYAVLGLGFLVSLLSRYIPGVPFGLSIDALLGLSFVALLFSRSHHWKSSYFSNPLTLLLLIWLSFSFVELFNPLAKSRVAWFYANRGLSIYPVLLVITTLYVFRKTDFIKKFLVLWVVLSLVGTFWGIKQLFFGVSAIEQAWLNAGAASTHVLFGKLRVFSYYSDAAQFGASQAHTAVVFGIIGLYPGKLRFRWLYVLIGLLSFYGMLISGTRGALGVVALGGLTYLIMTKNFRMILAGAVVAGGFFVFLKYTTLMQSNYQVNRMRTALRADDPSLQVRKEREAILGRYMADKPIGGGIGSAGYWGKRFSPGTFLAELGTDGHYTRIWMETGIIGLLLYLLILLSIVFYLGRLLWKMPDSRLRQVLIAFYSGFLGLCLASYTNGLLTQIPTGTIVFISLAVIQKTATLRLKLN